MAASSEWTADMEREYADTMRPLQFALGAFTLAKYHYAGSVASGAATNKKRMKRIAQEQADMMHSLPLNSSSSVFVRVPEDKMDTMQAIIVGPEDTPYSGGCFLFDIYFSPEYPVGAPKVNLQTTGGGSVRFNPNLYNCGKVCLSLLGTWQGSEGENWNKDTSTMLQVLVSIQSLILVPEPYFNEPGYQSSMHTEEGRRSSFAYSEERRVGTIRWAMIDQLRNPPAIFADVIRNHFRLRRRFLLAQCEKWIEESAKAKSSHASSLRSLTAELRAELEKL